MAEPQFADYVWLIDSVLTRFRQAQVSTMRWGRPFHYEQRGFLLFELMMQCKRKYAFKAQARWLRQHSTQRGLFGLQEVPHRTQLSRRYKALYPLLQELITFVGQDSAVLDLRLDSHNGYIDKSLFKAQGPVWHQRHRKQGRIPAGLRHLDTDATWSKSAYHGWVYGYGLHIICNEFAFPLRVQVETAAYSEKQMLIGMEQALLADVTLETLTGDNSYTQARRIRRFAKYGLILLTPAAKWTTGRYARAYHVLIKQPRYRALLRKRRTTIEPLFDLVAKVIGATDNHKQLPLQRLPNVRTCLALATFTVQIAMLANSIWNRPLRSISHICEVFS